MILGETKNWIVEQGVTGNCLFIFNMKNEEAALMVNHFAHSQTIECDDDLTKLPETLKKVIRKWCADKADELLAKNEVTI